MCRDNHNGLFGEVALYYVEDRSYMFGISDARTAEFTDNHRRIRIQFLFHGFNGSCHKTKRMRGSLSSFQKEGDNLYITFPLAGTMRLFFRYPSPRYPFPVFLTPRAKPLFYIFRQGRP